MFLLATESKGQNDWCYSVGQQQVIRVYSLPDGTFSSDEEEEEEEDEEDEEEEGGISEHSYGVFKLDAWNLIVSTP